MKTKSLLITAKTVLTIMLISISYLVNSQSKTEIKNIIASEVGVLTLEQGQKTVYLNPNILTYIIL